MYFEYDAAGWTGRKSNIKVRLEERKRRSLGWNILEFGWVTAA
jgi:hypothetical protein